MALPDLLERLLTTPGPSGQERAAAAVWREAADSVGEVSSDALGSSWVRVPGTGGGASLALVGHIDEIGMVVTHLGDDGLAALRPIGGFDPHVMLGQRVHVLARGGAVPGVVGARFQKRKRGEDASRSTTTTSSSTSARRTATSCAGSFGPATFSSGTAPRLPCAASVSSRAPSTTGSAATSRSRPRGGSASRAELPAR